MYIESYLYLIDIVYIFMIYTIDVLSLFLTDLLTWTAVQATTTMGLTPPPPHLRPVTIK